MMAVKLGGKNVMAVSLYPKEGNPLWEEYSTKAVVQTSKPIPIILLITPIPRPYRFMPKTKGWSIP